MRSGGDLLVASVHNTCSVDVEQAARDVGEQFGRIEVLDVATGPGEAASVALSQIGTSGLVVGVDISAEMLRAGSTRFTDGRFRPVMADGQALPFADGTFDAVICQLGLMFFPNPVQGFT
jgi:ubiquinone/menaquinone biosynthesis C-methylase UbiE